MRTELEILLEERFPIFHKIWIQRTKLNSICITLFSNNDYNMLFDYRLSNKIDFHLCEKMIENYLNNKIT